jgi:hypothetical protein
MNDAIMKDMKRLIVKLSLAKKYPTFWNSKVLYHIYESPPLLRILGQVNSIYMFTLHCSKINVNITLQSTPKIFSSLFF